MYGYINLFEQNSEYEEYVDNKLNHNLPHINGCVEQDEIYYQEDNRIAVAVSANTTSSPVKITHSASTSLFDYMVVDGYVRDDVQSAYTFNSTGNHVVKYSLKDIENTGDYTFYSCTGITDVYIPNGVKTIGYRAFSGCANIKNIKFGNTIETIGTETFSGLYNLESVNLPNSLKTISVNSFSQCVKVSAITIPSEVTTIQTGAFNNCSALTNLNVVSDNTKYDSRNNCNAIIQTNNNTLVIGCKSTVIPNTVTQISYRAFLQCRSLTDIIIPSSVTYIADGVFYQCSNLQTVIMESPIPPTLGGNNAFDDNASGRKIYVPAESLNAYKTATNWSEYEADIEAIPYSMKYLTFDIVSAGTITIKASDNSVAKTLSYSTDGGNTWSDLTTSSTEQSLGSFSAGDTIMLKGTNTTYGTSSYYNQFGGTAKYNVYGNIMSLLYGDDFGGQTTIPSGSTYTFKYLFNNSTGLINASNLILPATTLKYGCYQRMFYGCTGLTTAPELPATTLADYCYYYMFRGCTSLITAPELPATTLVTFCYDGMFYGCTSLTTAPELPATTLDGNCYNSMFYGCRSLTTAPELPATTLEGGCYQNMFYGCTSLTTAPALPATTLVSVCYCNMFYGCTGLTTAPELPATTLVTFCYDGMFNGCTSLNYIKAMFTTTPSASYTPNWVKGVASTGTFVKNSAADWDVNGVHGIPTGWTIQTASS